MGGGDLLILFFFTALGFAILLNFLLLKFLKNVGLKNHNSDNPSFIRWASQNKPAIGGWSLFVLFLLSIAAYFVFPQSEGIELSNRRLFALLGSTTFGFIVGLIDDAYEMPPVFKFLGQLGCAGIILSMGIYIPISGLYWFDALFSVVWITGIMNSINMLDNMDGIAASVSVGVVLACLLVLQFAQPANLFFTVVLVGVLAALIGFLAFNRFPAKMYMGDSGSQLLGAFLAFTSILLLWQFRIAPPDGGFSMQQFVLPLIAFLPALMDTTTVAFRRIGRGVSPFTGGRDHTTHHLAYCGLRDDAVMFVFATLALLSAGLCAVLVRRLPAHPMVCTLFAFGYAALLFGAMQWFYQVGKKKQQNKGKSDAFAQNKKEREAPKKTRLQ